MGSDEGPCYYIFHCFFSFKAFWAFSVVLSNCSFLFGGLGIVTVYIKIGKEYLSQNSHISLLSMEAQRPLRHPTGITMLLVIHMLRNKHGNVAS